ncbi:MAG TPA: hypothetical protein VGJ84_03570 [Polyangiaceae bacterium]
MGNAGGFVGHEALLPLPESPVEAEYVSETLKSPSLKGAQFPEAESPAQPAASAAKLPTHSVSK